MVDERASILFTMTDHQRSDNLGMIQARQEVTPNLNQFASMVQFSLTTRRA